MPSNHYLGNPKLKSANVPVEFTEEQLAEYIKCQSDPIHFIKKFVKIIHDTYKNLILECKKLIDETNCPNEQILALLSLVASNFSRNISDKK